MLDELRERLVGCLTALLTPFHADGKLRLGALESQVEFQLSHDVSAMVIAGSIGEAATLSVPERIALADRFVQDVGGRALAIVSVTHDSPCELRRLTEHAAQIGADALLVSVPPFFRLTEDEQRAFWDWFSGTAQLPFIVYCSGHGASPRPSLDLLDDVLSLPNVLAVKEASADISRIDALVERYGDRLPIIAAGEKTLADAVVVGAEAAMTASGCFAPNRVQDVLAAVRRGDVASAEAGFEPVVRFRSHFQPEMDAGFPSYIAYTKAACEVVGLPVGPPRLPLHPASPADRREFERDVQACSL